jgi:dephospho-CoA kinase
MHLWCGAIIVVAVADPDVQARRLLARDAANGLTPEDARNRIASQTDVRVKAERCAELGPDRGIVLWNDGEKEDLRRSVDDAVARLKGANPPWWHWLLLGCPPLAVVAGTLAVCRNWTASKRWQAQRKEA